MNRTVQGGTADAVVVVPAVAAVAADAAAVAVAAVAVAAAASGVAATGAAAVVANAAWTISCSHGAPSDMGIASSATPPRQQHAGSGSASHDVWRVADR